MPNIGSISSDTDMATLVQSYGVGYHDHPQSEVDNLVTDLSGKAASGHTHSGVYEPAGVVATHEAAVDPHTGYLKESDANWLDLTDLGETTLHSHAAGSHPDLASHDTLGLATQTELDNHAGAADPHSVYVLEGAIPGGELGGTYAIPTVDATHSGSTHAATQAAAEATAASALASHVAAADPHTGYVREADANWIDLTDGGATTLHSHAGGPGGSINTLRTTVNQTINGGAGVFVDVTGLTFPVVNGVDYAFDFYVTFQSAATTTGWKAGVNCPAGTLDFWATSQTIANGAAGVATHTERHNTVRDDMTQLTATVTQAVDLNVRIRGRYLCTANGTFAVRFANELVSNTQLVVQKGSWGMWF